MAGYLTSGAWIEDIQSKAPIEGDRQQRLSAASQNVQTYIGVVDAGVAPDIASPAWQQFFTNASSGPLLSGIGFTESDSGSGTLLPLTGGGAPHVIIGSQFDDLIFGTSGADQISGQAGNDQINGLDGGDTVNGDDGDDQIIDGAEGQNYAAWDDVIHGGAGNDAINGGEGADFVNGGDGDDVINGGEGAGGEIHGGAGNDALVDGAEGGVMYGEEGDDTLTGGADADILVGGAGDDTLIGGAGGDIYRFAGSDDLGVDSIVENLADAGSDLLDFSLLDFGTGMRLDPGLTDEQLVAAGAGAALFLNLSASIDALEVVRGTANDDILYATPDINLVGLAGDDTYVFAGTASLGTVDIAEGATEGNDTFDFSGLDYSSIADPDAGIVLDLGDATLSPAPIVAQYGANLLALRLGSSAANIENVVGTQFADHITGNSLANRLDGAAGADQVSGGAGNDYLGGGDGNDELDGGDGDDAISGGDGDDDLDGGDGNDSLSGDDGVDTMIGGLGSDNFTTDASDPESAPEVDPMNGGMPIELRADQSLVIRVMADDVQDPYGLLTFTVLADGTIGMNDALSDGPGIVSAAPGWLAPGPHTITVTVTDQSNRSTTSEFVVNVSDFNKAPPAGANSAPAGVAYAPSAGTGTVSLVNSGSDSQSLSSVTFKDFDNGGASDATLSNAGDFSWHPDPVPTNYATPLDPQWYGAYRFVATITDDGAGGDGERSRKSPFYGSGPFGQGGGLSANQYYQVALDGSRKQLDPGNNLTAFKSTPLTTDGYFSMAAGATLTGSLHAFASYDQTFAMPTYAIVGGPSHGSLTITNAATGEFTYTPNLDGNGDPYSGLDTFSYQINDPASWWEYNSLTEIKTISDANYGNVAFVTIRVGDPVVASIKMHDATDSSHTIWVNEDDDDASQAPDDRQLFGGVADEDDLIAVDLSAKTQGDINVTDLIAHLAISNVSPLDAVRHMRVWDSPNKLREIFVDWAGQDPSGTTWRLDQLPGQVWVEGLSAGASALSLVVQGPASSQYTHTLTAPNAPGAIQVQADVLVRVLDVRIDLDVDSDNNNAFGFPDGSNWEETLEDNRYGLGKLIMLDNPTRAVTPVVLRLAPDLDPNDPTLRVRLDWEVFALAGDVILWDTPVVDSLRNPGWVDAGGDRITPQFDLSLADLNYNPATGLIVVYAEGVRENPSIKTLAGVEQSGKPQDYITATLVVNGNDARTDRVKYIVANEDSFFYQLQTREEVRDAIASWGVYRRKPLDPNNPDVRIRTIGDMPDYSLQMLNTEQLAALDVPADIAGLLGPPARNGVPGFNAAIYRDYITGEAQYALAFAGTDDDVWANEFDDWINNVEQGLGFAAPQYRAAVRMGDALSNVATFQNGHLIVTGHSLGGGLASAAAVVGGFSADTYNSAGLQLTTIYRDANGNLIPNGFGGNVEQYPGAAGRYNTAFAWINAYYAEYDVLSFLQDVTTIPNALGFRIRLDTPFDLEMAGNAAVIVVAAADGQPWQAVSSGLSGLLTMVQSHAMTTILYGLLARENYLGGFSMDTLGYEFYF